MRYLLRTVWSERPARDALDISVSVARAEYPLDAKGLCDIVTLPEQQGSVIRIEDRNRQLSQPLWPQRKAMPPHRLNLGIGIDSFRYWSDHPCCRPGS